MQNEKNMINVKNRYFTGTFDDFSVDCVIAAYFII